MKFAYAAVQHWPFDAWSWTVTGGVSGKTREDDGQLEVRALARQNDAGIAVLRSGDQAKLGHTVGVRIPVRVFDRPRAERSPARVRRARAAGRGEGLEERLRVARGVVHT